MRRNSILKKTITCQILILSLFLLSGHVHARFRRPDLMQIPVQRLITNLEQMVQNKPKDLQIRFNLARTYAMAYAEKVDEVKVQRKRLNAGAWFGYVPKFVPFKMKPAATEAQKKAAQEYLKKALSTYESVLKLKEDHLASKLGRAWLLDQSGEKKKAIQAYRDVIEMAWNTEGKLRSGRLGGRYITVEAADYLIPLLDAKKDEAEIERLRERVTQLKRLRRPITPIAIPVRKGLKLNDLLDRKAQVTFDADGSGIAQKWSWIRPNSGWLVYRQSGNKTVTSALQLFGNVTFWTFWDNGYQALQTLDDDGDGFLSGKELRNLAIWRDLNSDGICQSHEVQSLAKWGIVKLSCRWKQNAHGDCAAWSPNGATFKSGQTRPTFDVILRQR